MIPKRHAEQLLSPTSYRPHPTPNILHPDQTKNPRHPTTHTHTHTNLAQDSNGVAHWRVPKKRKIQINMAIFVLKTDGRQQRRSSLESSLDPTTSGPLRTPANFRVPANKGPGKRGGNC